jgi:probable phosphoglycerate mutase
VAARHQQAGPTIFDVVAEADIPAAGLAAPASAAGPGAAVPESSADTAGRGVSAREAVPDRLVVVADGGSRGNPGPAAYGAAVLDATTGEVLDSEGWPIGTATNNVAEYSGLVAGLEMARAINPGAQVEVRMDSKLVIEQMAGRWKIKHPDMRELALKARRIVPGRVAWVWVPRAQNSLADGLVNMALDGDPRRRRS